MQWHARKFFRHHCAQFAEISDGARHAFQALLMEQLVDLRKVPRFGTRHILRALLPTFACPVDLGCQALTTVREINHHVIDKMIGLGRVAHDADIP